VGNVKNRFAFVLWNLDMEDDDNQSIIIILVMTLPILWRWTKKALVVKFASFAHLLEISSVCNGQGDPLSSRGI
jgi:hypothetical protein